MLLYWHSDTVDILLQLFTHMFSYDLNTEKSSKVPWNKAISEDGFKYFTASPDGQLLAFLGKDGAIHILSAKSLEWIKTLNVTGTANDIAFSGNSKLLYTYESSLNLVVQT